jgi:3-dehydroquinate dehydratase II
MRAIWVIQGPNLNLLGSREPHLYGTTTLDDLHRQLVSQGEQAGVTVTCYQSNHEGQLIDWLHQARQQAQGVILNPGGYTHTSVALRDAVAVLPCGCIEVHISNIAAREPFRQHSLISPVATGVIAGLGVNGYSLALTHLVQTLAL